MESGREWSLVVAVALLGCAARPPLAVVARDSPDVGAVVRIRGTGACLAVRVAPGTLLTAAHCVVGVRSLGDIRVGAPPRAVRPPRVLSCVLHPTNAPRFDRCDVDDHNARGHLGDVWGDLAILRVGDDPAGAPVLPSLESLADPESLVGLDAWVISDDAPTWIDASAPRPVRNRVTFAEQGEVRTAGADRADISTRPGDSGGPLLMRRSGRWVVVGVLSGGASDYSPDSRFAPTFAVETSAWLARSR